MKSIEIDTNILRKILPLHVTSYLDAHNWESVKTYGEIASIWQKCEGDECVKIIVPSDTELADYISRILDVIKVLSKVEKRSLDYIITDILRANADTIRITAYKGKPVNSLPLQEASNLLKSSLDMIASVAQSIIKPRPYFCSRYSKEVEDFVDGLKMGHTEQGSFIVNIFSKTDPRLQNLFTPIEKEQELLDKDDEPLGRKTIMRISQLLPVAINAANNRDKKQFMDSIKDGMSANFCEAVSEITKICGEDGANIDISWAPVRPVMPYWHLKTNFNIRQDTADVLTEAAQQLRTLAPEKDVDIRGYVVKCEKNETANQGEIKVNDISNDKSRAVYLVLKNEEYKKAVLAHKDGIMISAKGDIEKQAKKQILKNIRDFETIQEE